MTFSFDTAATQGAVIIIGVGGGGGNAINRMIDEAELSWCRIHAEQTQMYKHFRAKSRNSYPGSC